MFNRVPGCICIQVAVCIAAAFPYAASAGPALTQREAIERALREHPALAAQRESIAAFEAAGEQAGLRLNPELIFEIEKFRFSDGPDRETVSTDTGGASTGRSLESIDNGALRESEITLAVSQTIELGRKRAKRFALADHATQVALWDYEVSRAEVIASTRQAFIAVLAGQERVALRQRLTEVADRASQTVRERVEGGKVSPLQGNRADIERAQTRIALTSAERALAAARFKLAAQWGATTPDFDAVTGDFAAMPQLPNWGNLNTALNSNPSLARWTAEIERRESAVNLARARGVPDLTLTAGWRNTGLPDSSATNFDGTGAVNGFSRSAFADSRDNSFVLGVSIPLPLFNRNQGSIREAEHRVRQAEYEKHAYASTATGNLAGLYEQLAGLAAEIDTLGNEIVPAAIDTYEGTQDGFELGKFPYINVLDAQRTLFEVRNQHMEALASYHAGVAELERLLGSALTDFNDTRPEEALPQ